MTVTVRLEPRAVTRKVAAEALGIGLSYFEAHVQPELKVLRLGSRVLVPVSELDRYVREHAEATLPDRSLRAA